MEALSTANVAQNSGVHFESGLYAHTVWWQCVMTSLIVALLTPVYAEMSVRLNNGIIRMIFSQASFEILILVAWWAVRVVGSGRSDGRYYHLISSLVRAPPLP